MIRFALFALSAWAGLGPVLAQSPTAVHTSRENARMLALPKGDDMFHIVIFGDRTGGLPEGIEVLEQAVIDTNLLDPDLVMTVGDLVNGYNEAPEWLEQMEEFRGVMNGLNMPWFPVAGNHDVYWRGDGERPLLEHEALYEKHFGPFWYWFEHKGMGFVVLYTDEGNPDKGPKSFQDPEQMQMSAEQLGWLKTSLGEMKYLSQVFVFLHHPRWLAQYRASNWEDVHRILVQAGNVKGVFAGHIHRLNYAGNQDGIEYFALATTGGSMPGHMPQLGYVHHFNVLTIRKEGFSMAILPVGSAIDPRQYSPKRLGELDQLRTLAVTSVYGPVYLDETGAVNTEYAATIRNPGSHPIDVTLAVPPNASGWQILPDHRHALIGPRERATFSFRIHRSGRGFDETFGSPEMALHIDYLEGEARVSLPVHRVEIPVQLSGSIAVASKPGETNSVVALNERSCLRVDLNRSHLPADSAFTLETWVRLEKEQDDRGLIAKTENSEFAFFLHHSKPAFNVHLGAGYVTAKSEDALSFNQWHHLAGVYDGEEVRLYVDGRLVSRRQGSGGRTLNRLPLYVGADVAASGVPVRHFEGMLDEVRLSRAARYDSETFEPVLYHRPDADTVFLYHFDQQFGPFHPDSGNLANHAMRRGNVHLQTVELPVLTTD